MEEFLNGIAVPAEEPCGFGGHRPAWKSDWRLNRRSALMK